jgi:hypothetical protein
MPVIPACGRLRQEDLAFETSLVYKEKTCLSKKKEGRKRREEKGKKREENK